MERAGRVKLRLIDQARAALDQHMVSRAFPAAVRELPNAITADPPFDLEAVGWQAAVQSIGHTAAVQVRIIFVRGCAELGNIERGVDAFQWIERPGHEVKALLEDVLALK